MLVSFKLYPFKSTADNVEQTYGCVFKERKHLEHKTAAWTQQAYSRDNLSVKQCSNFLFLFTRFIGAVDTAISCHLTEHNVHCTDA